MALSIERMDCGQTAEGLCMISGMIRHFSLFYSHLAFQAMDNRELPREQRGRNMNVTTFVQCLYDTHKHNFTFTNCNI